MEDNQSFLDLQVDEQASVQLTETSRWAKFLGIAILILLAIFLAVFAMMWSKLDSLFLLYEEIDQGSVKIIKMLVAICLVIVAILTIVLMTFLIKGANGIRNGIRQKDQILFNNGLANFRNYLAMAGVLGILSLLFSLIGFFFG